jgi:hypothetical protein
MRNSDSLAIALIISNLNEFTLPIKRLLVSVDSFAYFSTPHSSDQELPFVNLIFNKTIGCCDC